MCYSAMQAQAAKSKFFNLNFKARIQPDMDGTPFFPLGRVQFGRLDAAGGREAVEGQFGLVPPWVTDEKGGTKFGRFCYNARSETIFEKPSFRREVLTQRAVIPVDAFYEVPEDEKPVRHRYRIFRKDGAGFWLAGLWAWHPGYKLLSCTFATTTPINLLSSFHSRSPVILDDDQVAGWLDASLTQPEKIAAFLKPHASQGLTVLKEPLPARRKVARPQD